MERDEPMAVVHVNPITVNEAVASAHGVLFVPPHFIYGLYENVEQLLQKKEYRMGGGGGGGSGGTR